MARQQFDAARTISRRAGELYGGAFGTRGGQSFYRNGGAHRLADAGIDMDRAEADGDGGTAAPQPDCQCNGMAQTCRCLIPVHFVLLSRIASTAVS